MTRVLRFFFGSWNRALASIAAIAITVAAINPDFAERIAFGVAERILFALQTGVGAILAGIFGAADKNSVIVQYLVTLAITCLALFWMTRGALRSIFGLGKKKKKD